MIDSGGLANDDLPVVTAVITTHNRLDLLRFALTSALNQTYQNLEIIVVDDGSVDGTEASMAAEASCLGFNYLRIDPLESRGGCHARNVGILAARGSWVAFLDDDDMWMPDKIEKQVNCALSRRSVGVVGCGRAFLDVEGRYLDSQLNVAEGDLSQDVLVTIPFVTSTLLIKRELLLTAGLFDESLSHWQEYELEMRLFQQTEVAAVDEALVMYLWDTKDPKRLSNDLAQWEHAVALIEEKHEALLANIPGEVRRRRERMIARDGANRALASGDKRAQRDYLKKSFVAVPGLRSFLKWILRINSLRFWSAIR